MLCGDIGMVELPFKLKDALGAVQTTRQPHY